MKEKTILDCGHEPSPHSDFTTGYGTSPEGKTYCYDCCAERERQSMIETGKATLYLVSRKEMVPIQNAAYYGHAKTETEVTRHYVTDWAGKLEFRAYHVSHKPYGGGFGTQRTDAYFTGPDGKRWHAVNRGDMQVARCRRMKG